MPKIAKAYAISDAHITFVSLVDKAANKKTFLIAKSKGGKAEFRTYGRILKADADAHYVTGIVYEPMVEDTQGNYMTAEEIEKSAHWFMKNGNSVDVQHSFEPIEGASVVESWVAKSDCEIEGDQIKAGTWVMTMEITDPDIFAAIEKGDITGFSMGGTGVVSETDDDITDGDTAVSKSEGKGLLKKFAGLFGLDVVEKGAVRSNYNRRIKSSNFWTAYSVLEDYLLDSWNASTGKWEPQTDPDIIQEALQDFTDIATELLTGPEPVSVTLAAEPVTKAGKAISSANLESLRSINSSLTDFLSKFEEESEEEEEIEVTKSEMENIVTEAITKAMAASAQSNAEGANSASGAKDGESSANVQKVAESGGNASAEPITKADIERMVAEAVTKATQPQPEAPMTAEDIQKCIEESVAKAVEPILKATGTASNLNGIQKGGAPAEEHYMHGIFDI